MALLRWLASGVQPESAVIEPLTPEAAARLRPGLVSRFTSAELARRVASHPELAWVVASRGQPGPARHGPALAPPEQPPPSHFAIGGHWRRRAEIGEVLEVTRGPHRAALLHRLLDAFAAAGAELVVLDFEESGNDRAFYTDEGFGVIERIVEYERRGCRVDQPVRPVATRRCRPSDLPAVLEIERQSFPWLWWNSAAELAAYEAAAGVELHLSFEGAEPVGYAGITVRGSAGHLDRLAVRRDCQGRGHGAALLCLALERMRGQGVRRVSLSTQEDNLRSQALYERFGFRRGRWVYDIWGYWLRELAPSLQGAPGDHAGERLR